MRNERRTSSRRQDDVLGAAARDEIHWMYEHLQAQQRMHEEMLREMSEISREIASMTATLKERCPQHSNDLEEHKKDTKEKMVKLDERTKTIEYSMYRAIGVVATVIFLVTTFGGFVGRMLEQIASG